VRFLRIDGRNEYHWGRVAGSLRSYNRWHSRGEDYIHVAADQIAGHLGQPIDVLSRPVLDDEVLPFDISKAAQGLPKGQDVARRRFSETQYANAARLRWRLGMPGRRASHHASEDGDELSPFHSITSSARASRLGCDKRG
jgi:hypothetical protein